MSLQGGKIMPGMKMIKYKVLTMFKTDSYLLTYKLEYILNLCIAKKIELGIGIR